MSNPAASPSTNTALQPQTLSVARTPIRIEAFCAYVEQHVPEIIKCLETYCFTRRSAVYISVTAVLKIGIIFQINRAWLEEKRIPLTPTVNLPLSVLCRGMLKDFRALERQGSLPAGSPIELRWWHTDRGGEGVVLPNEIGGVVIKWYNPTYCFRVLIWAENRPGEQSGHPELSRYKSQQQEQ